MPDVTFAPGVDSSPQALDAYFQAGTVGATIDSIDTTSMHLSAGHVTMIIHGTGITFKNHHGAITITGGTVTGVETFLDGAAQTTFTGFDIKARAIQQAAIADATGADNAAVENLFLKQGYTYHGNGADDVLLATATSPDGIPLNFSGRDKFITGGGNDNIFLGDGNDIGQGGAGNDTFLGGVGNDKLYGGSGADSLQGDDGQDKLTGGTGNDTLSGGNGSDTFVFKLHDGADRITDFSTSLDSIDLPAAVPHSFTASGATDTLLHYGTFGDTILLVGVEIGNAGLVHLI